MPTSPAWAARFSAVAPVQASRVLTSHPAAIRRSSAARSPRRTTSLISLKSSTRAPTYFSAATAASVPPRHTKPASRNPAARKAFTCQDAGGFHSALWPVG